MCYTKKQVTQYLNKLEIYNAKITKNRIVDFIRYCHLRIFCAGFAAISHTGLYKITATNTP